MHRNHIFVIRGDVTQIACDAWLLPSDEDFTVEPIWKAGSESLDLAAARGRPWGEGELVRKVDRPPESKVDRSSESEPTVWMGNVGTVAFDLGRYLAVADAFVSTAARDLQPRDPETRAPKSRSHLLALHHLGTGAGGAEANKGDVLAALFTRLVETLDALGKDRIACDVVVVSWDAAAHAAAQRARLRALVPDPIDERDTEAQIETLLQQWPFADPTRSDALVAKARKLAELAQEGQLSVFMGAGASAGAGLPGWNQLLRKLGTYGTPEVTKDQIDQLQDPRDRAALVKLRMDAAGKDLSEALATELRATRYSLLHGLLSSLPVTEFITTNFDELFEKAARSAQRTATLRVIGGSGPDPSTVTTNSPVDEPARWLLKLHGTISQPDSTVLTRSDYFDGPRTRGALVGLVQAMLMTRHMLFIGYGLGDEDFHEIVHEVRAARGRNGGLGTAVTLFDEPVQAELWRRDVEVVAVQSVEGVGSMTPEQAGREVELFIDLLGLLAADREAFILDDEYTGMLDGPERALKEALATLQVPPAAEKHAGGRAVRALLERLGRRNS